MQPADPSFGSAWTASEEGRRRRRQTLRSLQKTRLLISYLEPATASALHGASGRMIELFGETDSAAIPNKSCLTNERIDRPNEAGPWSSSEGGID